MAYLYSHLTCNSGEFILQKIICISKMNPARPGGEGGGVAHPALVMAHSTSV